MNAFGLALLISLASTLGKGKSNMVIPPGGVLIGRGYQYIYAVLIVRMLPNWDSFNRKHPKLEYEFKEWCIKNGLDFVSGGGTGGEFFVRSAKEFRGCGIHAAS